MMVALTIATPADFRFRPTVESHGWYQLSPYHYDHETGVLLRKLKLADGAVVTLYLRGSKMRSVLVDVQGRPVLTGIQRNAIGQAVTNMFGLQINLSVFYQMMQKTNGYGWVDEHKAARMLAAPTVWEDLVKTLLTTNIAWSGTIEMARKLVSLTTDATFPTPQQIVALSEDDLSSRIGTGYRTPYLYELAQRIASGELNVEAWRKLNSDSLYKAITDLNGFGDYAAGTMLRLLGHFDRLAIDSVARKAYEHVTGHAPDSDTDIRKHYDPYGEWRGLVLWMDCIRDQYEPAKTPAE